MLTFSCLTFDELTNQQLYKLIQLREAVFIVEQDCPYLDCDDKDQVSHHVIGVDNAENIKACTRLVPPGISYEGYASIGRVVTAQDIRREGLGGPLMKYSIEQAKKLWPGLPIKISAQVYIKKFYNKLGFQEIGEEYLEDDIPHIAMIYTLEK